ncbi:MAG: hypothetical protein WBF83_08665 [Moheibacter sp.]
MLKNLNWLCLNRVQNRILSGFFLFCSIIGSAQNEYKIENIRAQSLLAEESMLQNPEKAFEEIKELLKKSEAQKDPETYLMLLQNQCRYYLIKSDYTNLMSSAEFLRKKSVEFNHSISEANAYFQLSNAYAMSGLNKEAEDLLFKGLKVLDKVRNQSDDYLNIKSKIYTAMANIANNNDDSGQQIKYLKMSMAVHSKLSDENTKSRLQFWGLSNLAAAYYDYDIDSAEYFALKSTEMAKKEFLNTNPMFMNYLVLGKASYLKNNYLQAIDYYLKGEKIKQNKYSSNVKELYSSLSEVYEAINDTVNSEKYKNRLNELSLDAAEKQNQSLIRIIENKKSEKPVKAYRLVVAAEATLLIVFIVFIVRFYRKNKILVKQERESQTYLKKIKTSEDTTTVKELIDIVSENAPGFLFAFEQVYPDFANKVLSIYPEASKSEIEFCAFIKINLSTKEIARYKMIHIRSVQNRKYRIRKKLNIPAEMDIYDWFKDF